MKLKRLEIHNYKSLRNVVLEPGPLSVFVGPNASGKSNLADALDFLGEVYRWDLEGAIKKKGGFENICFRRAKRSDQAIRFRVVLEVERLLKRKSTRPPLTGWVVDHTFEISGTRTSLCVKSEDLSFSFLAKSGPEFIGRISRSSGKVKVETTENEEALTGPVLSREELSEMMRGIGNSELILSLLPLLPFWASHFSKGMGALRVFQLSPGYCREAGVPTPNADLDRYGRNLPAVIDYLKSQRTKDFAKLLESARRIMPSLKVIDTDFTHTKTLGLFLREAGVSKPWTAEEISDGTIQAIALLAATFDSRIPILVIEEPENSVHPWAIRNFVEAFRTASEQKQIFLTTHSPVLIDQVRPEELWVVERPKLETKITPVLELDPSLKESWGQGKFTLSEYLDSGALPAAVPAASA